MDIGKVVEGLKQMKTFARKGWNGKGMWIVLKTPDVRGVITEDFVYMKTADNTTIPWLCSQADLLAEDWEER